MLNLWSLDALTSTLDGVVLFYHPYSDLNESNWIQLPSVSQSGSDTGGPAARQMCPRFIVRPDNLLELVYLSRATVNRSPHTFTFGFITGNNYFKPTFTVLTSTNSEVQSDF
jgi:hypothetical protein